MNYIFFLFMKQLLSTWLCGGVLRINRCIKKALTLTFSCLQSGRFITLYVCVYVNILLSYLYFLPNFQLLREFSNKQNNGKNSVMNIYNTEHAFSSHPCFALCGILCENKLKIFLRVQHLLFELIIIQISKNSEFSNLIISSVCLLFLVL